MTNHGLYWGDFHKHFEDLADQDRIMESARDNLDFYAVLQYPFTWYKAGRGLVVESVRNRPEYLDTWRELKQIARRYHAPGRFVTFLGYEWHGNRRRWGDHNVIYREPDDGELLDTWDLPDLYRQLQGRDVLVIPHHTAYITGNRGKDWSCWDAALSPVCEIFSSHGSSESCGSPRAMDANTGMGPRLHDGAYHNALAQGLKIGAIGSNDGSGLPGTWDRGLVGVWAQENTRAALWEAVRFRRCYAVTGDRIRLQFSVDGVVMGGELTTTGPVAAHVRAEAPQAIDRIELIHNGRLAGVHSHQMIRSPRTGAGREKILIECGWGPSTDRGFAVRPLGFEGTLTVRGGTLMDVQPRLTQLGQKIEILDPRRCRWRFVVPSRSPKRPEGNIQGLVVTVDDAGEAVLELEMDGESWPLALADLRRKGTVMAFEAETRRRIEVEFGLPAEEIENPDLIYYSSRKVKVHRAVPEHSWLADVDFDGVELTQGWNYLYARVVQTDGQMAWSSPIWCLRGE